MPGRGAASGSTGPAWRPGSGRAGRVAGAGARFARYRRVILENNGCPHPFSVLVVVLVGVRGDRPVAAGRSPVALSVLAGGPCRARFPARVAGPLALAVHLDDLLEIEPGEHQPPGEVGARDRAL